MKIQTRQSSHETIVKIFRDLGLDDDTGWISSHD